MGVVQGHRQPPPPPASARVTIKHMTAERVDLYRHVSFMGWTTPVYVTPFPVEESVTNDKDITWKI